MKWMTTDIVKIKMGEKDLKYIVILPGIEKEKVKISIADNSLMIETIEPTAWGEKFFYKDCYSYSKRYDIEKTKSTLKNGVLTISIPLKPQKTIKTHQIVID